MKTPHKHAEVIKAWADGAQVQIYTGSQWADVGRPSWEDDLEYRIKPEPRKGWYRVALYVDFGSYWTATIDHWGHRKEADIEKSDGFSRWLIPRTEYEVEE